MNSLANPVYLWSSWKLSVKFTSVFWWWPHQSGALGIQRRHEPGLSACRRSCSFEIISLPPLFHRERREQTLTVNTELPSKLVTALPGASFNSSCGRGGQILMGAGSKPCCGVFQSQLQVYFVPTWCWLAHCDLCLISGILYIVCSQFQILDIIMRLWKLHLEFWYGQVVSFNWKRVDMNHLMQCRHFESY